MADSGFSIALRNYAGVPVVELAGEINRRTFSALNDTLGKLARAGHYNVMVNVKNAVWHNLSALGSLEKVARVFREHYGHLEVIAEAAQIRGLLESVPKSSRLKFCTSEGQALTRIRKLPPPSVSGVVPMLVRLADHKPERKHS